MNEHTVVIVGSGFGGQCAAMRLLERGIDDFVILERRDFVGGTWTQNTYPGAAVDVPSPLYSIAGEPYPWERLFAKQHQLAAYTRDVIERHGLDRHIVLGAEVTGIEWEDDAWTVRTSAGDFRGQFVVNASGPLSTPVVPDFPGRDTFAGPAFHTNDWDHHVDLTGKRVAIIGSGASAAQVIPAIVDDVEHLHVFQRTPHWVLRRHDVSFGPRLSRFLARPRVNQLLRAAIYWNLETRIVGFKYSRQAIHLVYETAAKRLLRKTIRDPELRRKLTPDYTLGCKRVILSSALYPALARDTVTLHDKTDGIAEVTPTGIVTTQGDRVDVDVIVWSTGYDFADGLVSYPVKGVDGRMLADAWSPFPRAYLGTTIPSFPNLFVVTGPNTGIGHTSAIFLIEAQMDYIMTAIDEVRSRGARTIDVTEDAERSYTEMIHREMEGTVWEAGGCNSWYKSADGHVVVTYPGFSFTFRRLARDFRREDHRVA